jgi:hypothetical protein
MDLKEYVFHVSQDSFDLPTIIVYCLMILPLLSIFLSNQYQRMQCFLKKKIKLIR